MTQAVIARLFEWPTERGHQAILSQCDFDATKGEQDASQARIPPNRLFPAVGAYPPEFHLILSVFGKPLLSDK